MLQKGIMTLAVFALVGAASVTAAPSPAKADEARMPIADETRPPDVMRSAPTAVRGQAYRAPGFQVSQPRSAGNPLSGQAAPIGYGPHSEDISTLMRKARENGG